MADKLRAEGAAEVADREGARRLRVEGGRGRRVGPGLVGRRGERVGLEGGVGPGDEVAGAEVTAGQLDGGTGALSIAAHKADGVRLEAEGGPAVGREPFVDALEVGTATDDLVEDVDVAWLQQHARVAEEVFAGRGRPPPG